MNDQASTIAKNILQEFSKAPQLSQKVLTSANPVLYIEDVVARFKDLCKAYELLFGKEVSSWTGPGVNCGGRVFDLVKDIKSFSNVSCNVVGFIPSIGSTSALPWGGFEFTPGIVVDKNGTTIPLYRVEGVAYCVKVTKGEYEARWELERSYKYSAERSYKISRDAYNKKI